MIVVFSHLLISKSIFPLSIFFFGRKPSNINFDEGRPLDTRAVIAAQGPGIQITSCPARIVLLTNSSPGSHIPGIPASLTKAIGFPFLSDSIIFGILTAQMVNQKFHGRTFMRSVLLFPYVAPVVALAYTWELLLDPNSGTLNSLLINYQVIELSLIHI